MPKDQIKQILVQIADHEQRLKDIEGKPRTSATPAASNKQRTLREIVKGRKFKNGQEQITVIVGYHEKILGKFIAKDKLKDEWINAKITNKFSAEFLSRAKDVFVRVHPNDTCDLTQGGEDFFAQFLKNEPADSTSK